LPLDPVLQELRSRAEKPTSDLEIRPKFPHLLIAASLEPGQRTLSAEQTETLATHWPDLRARLRELQYNVKLDMYKYGLDDVSAVFDEVQRQGKDSPREPLKVKLVAVEPKWLCSTFAFHPMLGFRRTHQAKSIAHGCATTLCSLAEIRDGADEKWGLDESAIPRHGLKEALREHKGSRRFSKAFRDGKCWLLPEKQCPFAKSGEGSEHKDSAHWVAEIHRHCWDRKTHSPQAVV
jgi:hypothetical protein